MTTYWLSLQLLSDTTFGRGDGVAGEVDAEVQHDDYGLPYLGGKTLKALLTATCAEILYALELAHIADLPRWQASAQRLFGGPGSVSNRVGLMHVGDAQLPSDLRAAIAQDVIAERRRPGGPRFTSADVLASLTTVRRQTALDATGAPMQETLRSMRVIIRDTTFVSRLDFAANPDDLDLALLAACVSAFRRAGTGRNRGRGQLVAELYDQEPGQTGPVTSAYLARFRREVGAREGEA